MVIKLNKKIIQFIGVLISVLFLSNIFYNNVGAVSYSSTPYATEVVTYNRNYQPTTTNVTYSTTGTYELSIPARGLLNRLKYSFDIPSNIKSQMSGRQNFTLSFGVWANSGNLIFNSVSAVNDYLPVITEFVVSPSCSVDRELVYYYNDGNIWYPANYNNLLVDECYYHITIQGYIPNSENWNAVFSLGGTIVANTDTVDRYLEISRPAMTLFDSEINSVQGSIDSQTQQQQEHYEEQQNQAEEQGQNAQDNSDETQSQVDSKTQNLFSFITSFFGAFTNASPSNCNFDWGLADKGFGVIDMCQTNIPAELQSILSIVSILIVVPMVLWLINSIVGAFKEFQQ